jgi:hypothetical protein
MTLYKNRLMLSLVLMTQHMRNMMKGRPVMRLVVNILITIIKCLESNFNQI